VVHIKAINSSGVWSNEINLSINIQPPFWQTWWFIALSLLGIAGIMYWLYRYRVKQLLQMQQLRNNISRDLHDEIGSSVSSVNMLSMVAKKQLGDEHPVTPLLTQIGLSAQNAGDSIDEIIWSVNPNNDSAQETFHRLRKYLSDVFELHGIEYNILLPEVAVDKKLTMHVRRDLWLICKEAVNNMVKYSKCTVAQVELQIMNGVMQVKIEDNGVGFDVQTTATKKRNGLSNMRERVQKYKKSKFEIISQINAGTVIQFQIPVVS
jgi:signal transduction histidine kinase